MGPTVRPNPLTFSNQDAQTRSAGVKAGMGVRFLVDKYPQPSFSNTSVWQRKRTDLVSFP